VRILVDTNVLTRASQPNHPQHQQATAVVTALANRGHTLCLVPQNLYEFWVVCTRPIGENGLGVTVDEALVRLSDLKGAFELLDETPAFLPTWESLVSEHAVKGKSGHDARLVAGMKVHGLTTLLTFNKQDFVRYPGLAVWTPEEAISGSTETPRV